MTWKKTVLQGFFCIITLCIAFVLLSGCTSTPQPLAGTGDTVKVFYSLSLPDGTLFDTNENKTPLEFTIGNGTVVPGFEEAVIGLTPGQTITVTIPPEKGYGPYHPDLVNTLKTDAIMQTLDQLEADRNLVPMTYPGIGEEYIWRKPDGTIGYLKFSNITEVTTTVDENHPLAGKDLVFQITLVEIVGKP